MSNNTTTKEIYKQALNDILNSKTKDVAVLRKIALKAFTEPIRAVSDAQPLYWKEYSDSDFEKYLVVGEVTIACLINENLNQPDGGKWVLHDYDSPFAPIFGDGSMPDFDTLEEGKKYCEMKFLMWLNDARELLNKPTPHANKES